MSCPECFKGHVHDGTPKGSETKLHGLDVYVTEPEGQAAQGIIVVIPDAFGWRFINNRLLADTYAAKGGYKVYLPDFMNGTSAPVYMIDSLQKFVGGDLGFFSKVYHMAILLSGFLPWSISNRISRSHPIVRSFFAALRQSAEGASTPLGAAGFCWGGKHAVLLCAAASADDVGRPLLDAAFAAHPSYLVLPAEADAVAVPLSVAVGDKDNQLPPDKARVVADILEAKAAPRTGELRTYEGCGHGFAVRADPSLNDVSAQAAAAEDQAIAWFRKQFATVGR